MTSENQPSIGDENTLQGEKTPTEERSLGDRSTYLGSEESSLSDAAGELGLDDHDMEIVDLSKRYRIEKSLGKGGMGEVLLATDTRLDRQVAIKRIRADVAVGKTAAARFLTEAKAVASLNHNNVVSIHDYGRDANGPFLIMEYVSGGSLLQRCKQGPIELEQAIDIACQLCGGLGRAHDAGIIHRDIKPANILLTDDGIPKLTDFGLAKADSRDHTMTMAGAVLGTLDFMPPEQRRDASLTDSRSDLWSLSATLYQMVTGKSPRIIRFIDVPTSLQEVLGKALEEEKKDRYQTAIELRDALRGSADASEPVFQTTTDLGAGECPNCHSRNDASRKFCNGCGGSLRVPCLSCEAEIPIWEKFCGECGGKQAELLESRLAELEKQQVRAERLRGEYGYKSALAIAEKISAIEDERFSQYRVWSEEFAESTKAEWKREEESATQHYSEAKKHRDAFDYDSAIHAIESIPEAMRSSEINGYLSSLTSDRDELLVLMQTIRKSISNSELDGLLAKVERASELRGDREDLLKLRNQLRDRETEQIQLTEEAFIKAEDLLGKGKAKAALKLIGRVRSNSRTREQKEVERRINKIVLAENELSYLVQKVKADGVIEAEQVAQLIPVAESYLALNPTHQGVRQLHSDLLSRMSKIPASVVSQLPHSVVSQLSDSVISQLPPTTNSVGMELKLIPSGTFTMGDRQNNHQVTITKPFLLAVHEVTQGQYERVMGRNPSSFKGAQNPVEEVSWEDAALFCRRLSALPVEKQAAREYRLPTEAEWEYACRAGTNTPYSFGYRTESSMSLSGWKAPSQRLLGDYAWFNLNSEKKTHPVGSKKPNSWGLYDMHGNVWEWCNDWHGDYPNCSVTDPTGPHSGSHRVLRGGSWRRDAENCLSTYRRWSHPSSRYNHYGFRVVCVPSGQ